MPYITKEFGSVCSFSLVNEEFETPDIDLSTRDKLIGLMQELSANNRIVHDEAKRQTTNGSIRLENAGRNIDACIGRVLSILRASGS